MARRSPTTDTVRALFARSGNQCAFPRCAQALVNDRNQFVGQICHIEAALPGGERYNFSQTDEERRAYDNLLLFCYPHHVETNNVEEYPVDTLRRFKRDHEVLVERSDFKIDEAALYKIVEEMDRYWADIERLNTLEHSIAELSVRIDVRGSYLDVGRACENNIAYISSFHDDFRNSDDSLQRDFENLLQRKGIDPKIFEDVPYFENPFQNRNWELHHIGVPNRVQRLRIDLMHMEIKYLEEFLKTNIRDKSAHERLEQLKEQLTEIAQHAMVVD